MKDCQCLDSVLHLRLFNIEGTVDLVVLYY